MLNLPLINIAGLGQAKLIAETRDRYNDMYCSKLDLRCHDGMPVRFFKDRFDHAFFTSSDRSRRAHIKDAFCEKRAERLNWILEFITSASTEIKCKQFSPPPRWQRCYYSLGHRYIVWLEAAGREAANPDGWRFSSAYPVPAEEIKRTTWSGKILK